MNHRLVAALSTLLAGCSFVFGGGPPAEHEQMPYFDCPSTYGLPVADGVFATTFAIGAAATLSQSEAEYKAKNGQKANRNAAGGVNIALAAVTAGSAIYGIVQSNRCANAKEALKARIMAPMLRPPGRPAPAALPPPPPLPAPAPAPEQPPAPAPAQPPTE